jgi:hypothetical protein
VSTLRARTTDGGSIEFSRTALATGGEKVVFLSTDRRYVVGFYHGILRDRAERAERLQRILTRYNPTSGPTGAYWRPYFVWPTAVVDGDPGIPVAFARDWHLTWPVLGVVTPVYREQFFFRDRYGQRQEKEVKWFTGRKAQAFVPAEERGTFLTKLQVVTRLARAVRRMHFAGLAHSDLSNKNVLIDPKGGDAAVIDIDSLVVPGVAPPTVLGTPGYIAPEVLAGHGAPSIATDRHALAVLIHQLLLGRHPLQGKQVHSTRSAEEDERLAMGARALFTEHPLDKGNPPIDPIRVPYTRLGPFLAPLIEKAFVRGLHHPTKRPDAAEWEGALYRTFELLHPSPGGREWMLAGPGVGTQCPWTGAEHRAPIPIAHYAREVDGRRVSESRTLTLFHHLLLHDWHLRQGVTPDEHADRTPRAYVAQHGGRWWLVNVSGAPLRTGDGGTVAHQAALEIAEGVSVRSEADDARWLTFGFVAPAAPSLPARSTARPVVRHG